MVKRGKSTAQIHANFWIYAKAKENQNKLKEKRESTQRNKEKKVDFSVNYEWITSYIWLHSLCVGHINSQKNAIWVPKLIHFISYRFYKREIVWWTKKNWRRNHCGKFERLWLNFLFPKNHETKKQSYEKGETYFT